MFEHIAEMMHRTDPSVSFSIKFLNCDEIRYGENTRVVLLIHTEKAAGRVIRDGFLGFGGAYVNKESEIDGDLIS